MRPAHLRMGLAIVCVMLSAAPVDAASKAPRARTPAVTPAAIGWCTALLTIAGVAWAVTVHVAPRLQQDRSERERVTKLLRSLEQAQRARLAERERSGLCRRRPAPPARFEGGFSFLGGASAKGPPSPTPPPSKPVGVAPSPRAAPPVTHEQEPEAAETKAASEKLALLLEAITVAERHLEGLRARLGQADRERTLDVGALEVGERDDDLSSDLLTRLCPLGDVAASARTVDLGPLDLPGGETLDLGTLDIPDEVLDRLRALSEVAVSDGTVDLGPLELPGADSLIIPQDLVARIRALSRTPVLDCSLSRTINLGPLDLPSA